MSRPRQILILDGRVCQSVARWAASAPEPGEAGYSGLVEFTTGAWVAFTARTRRRQGPERARRDSFSGVVVTAHGDGKKAQEPGYAEIDT